MRADSPPWHDITRGTPAEFIAGWRQQRESALFMLAEAGEGRTCNSSDEKLRDLSGFVDWLFDLSARYRPDTLRQPVASSWIGLESQLREHLTFIDETLAAYGVGVAGAD